MNAPRCWHCGDTRACDCIACNGTCSACLPQASKGRLHHLCAVGAHDSCPDHCLTETGRVLCICDCHSDAPSPYWDRNKDHSNAVHIEPLQGRARKGRAAA